MLKMSWTDKGGLEIVDTDPFDPWACRYATTRTVTRGFGRYAYECEERVEYAVLDNNGIPNSAVNAVRAWIAENPGPPGWTGVRPAVWINGTVYALDYNDWVSLRGWT